MIYKFTKKAKKVAPPAIVEYYDLPYKLNGKCLWYKIDTKYIKEYINE